MSRSGTSTRNSRPRSTDFYDDAKESLWAELTPEFINAIPDVVPVRTLSKDRNDYIAHPSTGETLSPESLAALESFGGDRGGPTCPRARSSSPTA